MEDARVAELEMLVRVLSAGLGLEQPLAALPPTVGEQLAQGNDVMAIKAMRTDVAGKLSLLAAKRMVDEVKRGA